MHGNDPNPVRTQTTIRYTLPAGLDVHLTVYDILGREVNTLGPPTSRTERNCVRRDNRSKRHLLLSAASEWEDANSPPLRQGYGRIVECSSETANGDNLFLIKEFVAAEKQLQRTTYDSRLRIGLLKFIQLGGQVPPFERK